MLPRSNFFGWYCSTNHFFFNFVFILTTYLYLYTSFLVEWLAAYPHYHYHFALYFISICKQTNNPYVLNVLSGQLEKVCKIYFLNIIIKQNNYYPQEVTRSAMLLGPLEAKCKWSISILSLACLLPLQLGTSYTVGIMDKILLTCFEFSHWPGVRNFQTV